MKVSGLEMILIENFRNLIKKFIFKRKELALLLILSFSSITTEFTTNSIIASIFLPIADTIVINLE